MPNDEQTTIFHDRPAVTYLSRWIATVDHPQLNWAWDIVQEIVDLYARANHEPAARTPYAPLAAGGRRRVASGGACASARVQQRGASPASLPSGIGRQEAPGIGPVACARRPAGHPDTIPTLGAPSNAARSRSV